MKTAFTFLALLVSLSRMAAAQESPRTERSTFDVTTSVGLADKQTRDYFGTSFTAGLRKEWPLDKFISLNAAADFHTLSGKNNAPALNLVNVGGGVTVYPNSIVALLMKRQYEDEEAKHDSFYLDAVFTWNINSNTYGKAGSIPVFKLLINIKRYRLSNRLALSPKLGAQTVFFNKDNLDRSTFNYFVAGVGLSLGKFEE